MEFSDFREHMRAHFNKMVNGASRLYETDVDADELWNLYLDSFPAGTNEIYRKRREFDCSCCRHFMKTMGGVVAIKNGTMVTLWDFDEQDPTYRPVVLALSAYVRSKSVTNVFFTHETHQGTQHNFENSTNEVHEWSHFYLQLPYQLMNDLRQSRGLWHLS